MSIFDGFAASPTPKGGVLMIGRNDQGAPVGVTDAKKLLEDLPSKIRDVLGIMADVRLVKKSSKELIEIRIEPYPTPISYKGEYYIRSGSTKQELKGAALERFLLKKRGRRWDDTPEPNLGMKSCSPAAFKLFKLRAKDSGRMKPTVLRDSREVILDNLGLFEKRWLRRAAGLLFTDQPEKFVGGAWVKIGYFVTDDDLRYQDEVRGNLFEQVEQVMALLLTKYLKAYITYHGLQRHETFLFPESALRETLLNAIVHKDYSRGIPTQISVYDDRIFFWNPGTLPEHWTVQKLFGKHASEPFNPLIANTFFRAGYIEAWGRGIEKIHRDCREHNIAQPQFDVDASGVMVTFRANPAQIELAGKAFLNTQSELGEKLGENRSAILVAMRQNAKVTTKELAHMLSLSTTAIDRNLQYLKQNNFIRRVGPAKGGHWEVLR